MTDVVVDLPLSMDRLHALVSGQAIQVNIAATRTSPAILILLSRESEPMEWYGPDGDNPFVNHHEPPMGDGKPCELGRWHDGPCPVPKEWCGDYPAPCNCDDWVTHDGVTGPDS